MGNKMSTFNAQMVEKLLKVYSHILCCIAAISYTGPAVPTQII